MRRPDLAEVRAIPTDPSTHRDLPSDHYWACQLPERPGDMQTSWGEGCPACLTHLAAQLHNEARLRDVRLQWRPDERTRSVSVRLADAVAYEATRLGNPILISAAARFGGDAARAEQALENLSESHRTRAPRATNEEPTPPRVP